jgi:hypothetical protein
MQTVNGVLKKITAKSGQSKNGPWTAYSLGVSVNGSDDYSWFRFGFSPPKATEGSVVSFDTIEDKPGIWKVVGEINVDKVATAAAPAASAKNYRGGKSDEVQDSIVRQSSTKIAIDCLDSMLEHGVVKLPGTAAKNYDFYKELLEKLTNEFFVANRNAKSVEDLASDGVEEEDEPINEGGPSEAEAWSPV